MRAALIHEWGTDPVVEEVREPALADHETLVAVEAASVAHIDLTVAGGRFAHRPALPHVPGTEGAGRILRSATFPEGAAVRIRGGGVGLIRDGTWAERVAVPDDALDRLPDGVAPQLAAVFFSPCVTAHLAVQEVGAVQAGERIAIRGAAGAVGSVACQLALERDAEVLGVESTSERATLVPTGARGLVGDAELADLDVLIDLVGGQGLADVLTRAMKPGGRAVLVGYAGGTEICLDLPALLAADVALLPVNLIRAAPRMREVARRMLERVQRGELQLHVTAFPLERVSEAIAVLRRGEAAGKVAVLPAARGV